MILRPARPDCHSEGQLQSQRPIEGARGRRTRRPSCDVEIPGGSLRSTPGTHDFAILLCHRGNRLTFIGTLPIIIGELLIFEQRGFLVVKKPVAATDAELAVLKVLWARGALTAKAITEAIYPDGAESEFAAVHSFLQRLERKRLVARDRSAFVHVFSPTVSQADILGQELRTLVERLGGDSIAPLIMQLIDQKRLSRKEAAEIRKLLERYSK
jgi:BlaI family penicillinase repressor